jgi:hypothetical protein
VLGKVLVHLDLRLFAPSVKSTGLIQRVYESFDILAVAAAPEPFHHVGKLSCPGCVLLQELISFLTKHPGATIVSCRRLNAFEAIVESSWRRLASTHLPRLGNFPHAKVVKQIGPTNSFYGKGFRVRFCRAQAAQTAGYRRW